MNIPHPYRGLSDYKYNLITMSDYKYNLITTIEELRKAIKENDESHMQVLFDRLEKRVINLRS
jgi:hypothetical protein